MGVVMQFRNIVVGAAIIASFAGCSMFGSKQVDYTAGATAVQPLEVPPDLVAPVVSSQAAPAADGTQVANYSDFARVPKPAEVPCSAPAAATASPAARLMQVGATRFILLSEPFDRAWRSTGQALERAGIKPFDLDRSKGLFFLKLANKDKTSEEAQLHLVETAGVTVLTVEGAALPESLKRLLDTLQQHMVQ